MWKKLLLLLLLALAYIFTLTVVFENFINKASSTVLTTIAVCLFLLLSIGFAITATKIFKLKSK